MVRSAIGSVEKFFESLVPQRFPGFILKREIYYRCRGKAVGVTPPSGGLIHRISRLARKPGTSKRDKNCEIWKRAHYVGNKNMKERALEDPLA